MQMGDDYLMSCFHVHMVFQVSFCLWQDLQIFAKMM